MTKIHIKWISTYRELQSELIYEYPIDIRGDDIIIPVNFNISLYSLSINIKLCLDDKLKWVSDIYFQDLRNKNPDELLKNMPDMIEDLFTKKGWMQNIDTSRTLIKIICNRVLDDLQQQLQNVLQIWTRDNIRQICEFSRYISDEFVDKTIAECRIKRIMDE
jgi:hypothetical protein